MLFRGQVFGLFSGGSKGAQRNLAVFICWKQVAPREPG